VCVCRFEVVVISEQTWCSEWKFSWSHINSRPTFSSPNVVCWFYNSFLSAHTYTYMCICLSICLSIDLLVYQSIHICAIIFSFFFHHAFFLFCQKRWFWDLFTQNLKFGKFLKMKSCYNLVKVDQTLKNTQTTHSKKCVVACFGEFFQIIVSTPSFIAGLHL
jgi:hypothetical protein